LIAHRANKASWMTSAYDPTGGRCFQCIGVFLAGEIDD
jgi:hypothetical protein